MLHYNIFEKFCPGKSYDSLEVLKVQHVFHMTTAAQSLPKFETRDLLWKLELDDAGVFSIQYTCND